MGKSDRAHILLLGGDGGYSGVPTYLAQLGEALGKQVDLSIVADRNRGGYDFCANNGIDLYEVSGMKTGLSPLRTARALRQLDRVIDETNPGLIWAHARMSLILLRGLSIHRRISGRPMPPFAVTYHGLPFGPGHRATASLVSLMLERFWLRTAPPHHLHFLSASAEAGFAARIPGQSLTRHSRHVLANCSDLGPIKPAPHPMHPTLLMSGRKSYQKNHAAAVELLAALPPAYRLILCGEGTETLAPLFDRHQPGLSNRVRFVGPVADVRPLLAEADLFLLPSRYEGMPLAALEAFEAGLPVVLSDTPGMSEILATHPMAHPMDIRNPAGAAAATVELVDTVRANPDIRHDIHAAWEKAFSRTRWQEGVQALLNKLSVPPETI